VAKHRRCIAQAEQNRGAGPPWVLSDGYQTPSRCISSQISTLPAFSVLAPGARFSYVEGACLMLAAVGVLASTLAQAPFCESTGHRPPMFLSFCHACPETHPRAWGQPARLAQGWPKARPAALAANTAPTTFGSLPTSLGMISKGDLCW
jgi:hypothetical protein